MARPAFRVRPSAWRVWEGLPDVPHPLVDVVEAMDRIPEGELEVRKLFRPPAVLHEVTGTVFGRRFTIRGVRGEGGKWAEVWSVRPS